MRVAKGIKIFIFIILPVALLAYLLIYTVLYGISLNQMIGTMNSFAPEGELSQRDRDGYSPEEFGLIREKSGLTARLKMAESDSIGLTLNLNDSLVQLELKGVILRGVKFSKFRYDRFFNSIHPAAYEVLFSQPVTIRKIEGASEKEPITYKKAPKDTIEASQAAEITIDSLRTEFIEWHMLLTNNILVSVVQSDSEKGKWNRENLRYRFRRYFSDLKKNTSRVFRLKKLEYFPEITIYIPAGEAKSFYRALPEKGEVCLRL